MAGLRLVRWFTLAALLAAKQLKLSLRRLDVMEQIPLIKSSWVASHDGDVSIRRTGEWITFKKARPSQTTRCTATHQHVAQLKQALLHDLGMVVLPPDALKREGPLTEDEWAVIQRHPKLGVGAISHVKALSPALPLIMSHQERYDGHGYPQRLRALT